MDRIRQAGQPQTAASNSTAYTDHHPAVVSICDEVECTWSVKSSSSCQMSRCFCAPVESLSQEMQSIKMTTSKKPPYRKAKKSYHHKVADEPLFRAVFTPKKNTSDKSAHGLSIPLVLLLIAFVLPTISCSTPFLWSSSPTRVPSGVYYSAPSSSSLTHGPSTFANASTTAAGLIYDWAMEQSVNYVISKGNNVGVVTEVTASPSSASPPRSSSTQHPVDTSYAPLNRPHQQQHVRRALFSRSTKSILDNVEHVSSSSIQRWTSSERNMVVSEEAFKLQRQLSGHIVEKEQAPAHQLNASNNSGDDGNQSANQSNQALYSSADVVLPILISSSGSLSSTSGASSLVPLESPAQASQHAGKITTLKPSGKFPEGCRERNSTNDHDKIECKYFRPEEGGEDDLLATTRSSSVPTMRQNAHLSSTRGGNKSQKGAHRLPIPEATTINQFHRVSSSEAHSGILPREMAIFDMEQGRAARPINGRDVVSLNKPRQWSHRAAHISDNPIRHLGEPDVTYDDYKFSESDDLFLLDDYRRDCSLRPSMLDNVDQDESTEFARGRVGKRSYRALEEGNREMFAESLTFDRVSQVQTIYFGGFFPWLSDEQIQSGALEVGDTKQRQSFGLDSGGERRSHSRQDTMALAGEDQVSGSMTTKHNKRRSKSSRHKNKETPEPSAAGQNRAINQNLQHQNQSAQHQQQQLTSTTANQYTNSVNRHQLGKFILPAVRLALDHINTNRTILSAYKLEVVPRDTQIMKAGCTC